MSQDFCAGCGVFLTSYSMICEVCGFDNSFTEYGDVYMDDDFLVDSMDDYLQESPSDL